MDALIAFWPWLLSILGIILLWLYGNKVIIAPKLGIFVQFCLIFYAVVTEQYGFIPGAIAYAFIHIRNWRKWESE